MNHEIPTPDNPIFILVVLFPSFDSVNSHKKRVERLDYLVLGMHSVQPLEVVRPDKEACEVVVGL